VALRILGLSSSRYHSWTRDENCALEDASSCPLCRMRHKGHYAESRIMPPSVRLSRLARGKRGRAGTA
jgi:hypothetical protein